jgi:hypothetical protein
VKTRSDCRVHISAVMEEFGASKTHNCTLQFEYKNIGMESHFAIRIFPKAQVIVLKLEKERELAEITQASAKVASRPKHFDLSKSPMRRRVPWSTGHPTFLIL